MMLNVQWNVTLSHQSWNIIMSISSSSPGIHYKIHSPSFIQETRAHIVHPWVLKCLAYTLPGQQGLFLQLNWYVTWGYCILYYFDGFTLWWVREERLFVEVTFGGFSSAARQMLHYCTDVSLVSNFLQRLTLACFVKPRVPNFPVYHTGACDVRLMLSLQVKNTLLLVNDQSLHEKACKDYWFITEGPVVSKKGRWINKSTVERPSHLFHDQGSGTTVAPFIAMLLGPCCHWGNPMETCVNHLLVTNSRDKTVMPNDFFFFIW